MKLLFALILALVLTGCSQFNQPFTPYVVTNRFLIDPKLLELCQDLPRLDSPAQFAEHYVLTISLYGECKSRQQASSDSLRLIGGHQ